MANIDPFLLDVEEHSKVKLENKGGGSGVICPKRNASINKPCRVCDTVRKLFNSKMPEKIELSYDKMTKTKNYLVYVTHDNPSEPRILEVGKKAGNDIIDGIEKGWVDIAHPMAGKGREIQITKKHDGMHNVYQVSPCLDKADWDVPQEALDAIIDLDDIIEYVKNGDPRIDKVSNLNMNQTLTLRILPPWNRESGNRRIITSVWRHWGGVTEEEVEGIIEMDTSTASDFTNPQPSDSMPPFLPDSPDILDTGPVDTQLGSSSAPPSSGYKPCFGKSDWFSMEDDECKACSSLSECKSEIKKNM